MGNEKKVTYRRVNHRMGGWRWGYPKGKRYSIVEYIVSGKRWKSNSEVCCGLTAANEEYFRSLYPDAFGHPIGSIHNHYVD